MQLCTAEETALEITLNDLTVTDPDNTYPDDFTLTAQDGENYTRTENSITPIENFVGDLSVAVTVNDGAADSEVFNVVVTVASDAKSGRNAGKGVILADKAHA